jgi:Arc/MetJ family transcription regulator
MSISILLDDKLIDRAQSLSQIKTKRELVGTALREFVAHRERLDLRELKGIGELRPDYDYKALRESRLCAAGNF